MKIYSILLLLVMVACRSSENTATDAANVKETPEAESVFDPLVESVEKAKGVEDVVMQQKQQMDDALREMEGETDNPDQ